MKAAKMRRTLLSTALIGAGLTSLLSAAAGAADNTPSVKVGRGDLVSPAAARTYYGSVSNPATTSSPTFASEPEIDALAAALKNDPDLIFEYVHDKIEFVPLYGLQKGALGTLIDKSGTAFDQAQLLVELLRAAGHTANYVMGDINVSGTEFEEWFGVDNGTVACHLLADGGIPATISGATATCGGLGSTMPSSITLSHIWVEGTATGSGAFSFDPSFKRHDLITGTFSNLKTEMGYTSGSMLTTAGSPSGNVGFNTSAINTSLDNLSSTLMGVMNSTSNHNKTLDELLGAELIKSLEELGATHTGVDGSYTSVGGTATQIPNAYRTLVTLDFSILDQAATSQVTFYADELYGRRLAFDWKANDSSVANPSTAGGRLTLDDQFVATINTFNPCLFQNPPSNCGDTDLKIANGNASKVKFTVNHAYASNSGAYMDRVYQRAVGGFSQSATFIFGFGGSTDALQSKITSEHYRGTHFVNQGICTDEGIVVPGVDPIQREINLIDHMKTQVGYGWLAQFSRAVDLQARAVGAVAQHHHSFGLAYTSATWDDVCATATNVNLRGLYAMSDNAVQIDMVSGLSINQRDGSETDRRATSQAMALAGATLEGSVFEQYAGKAHTASTTERFEWFNENATAGQSFRIVDDADWQTVNDSLPAAEKLSGYAWYQRYTNEGFIIIAPQGHELGPGAFGGAWPTGPSTSFERGSAFIAVKPDGSEAAHIVFTGLDGAKGGGAKQDDEEDAPFDPSKIADILKDQFEDRSQQHGINLANGQVSYSPPADLTTGAGEFPYSLSFQRSYNTAGSRARGLAVGWSHNWDINASASGSATEAMGATRAVRAVSSLVAFTVMQDVLARSTNYAKDTDTLKRVLTSSFVAHWWREHLQNNVVTIQQGAGGIQFVKLPGEVFDAPTDSNASLAYADAGRRELRYLLQDTCPDIQLNRDLGRCRQEYEYTNVGYRYTSADKDTILFSSGKDALAPNNGNVPQFLPEEWEFPAGVKLRFTHNGVGQITRVQSNLGGTTGTFGGPQLTFGWSGETLTSVTGTGLGSVSFGYTDGGDQEGNIAGTAASGYVYVREKNDLVLSTFTDLVGNTTEYVYTGNGLNPTLAPTGAINDWMPRLVAIKTPEYTKAGADGLATQEFVYDASWRAVGFKDGEAIRGNRGSWAFHIAPGHRGERIAPTVNDEQGNPVNPAYVVNYDIYGRAAKVTDEGGRITTASYDGIGRVLTRTFPSGAESSFAYDTKGNVTSFTTTGVGGTATRSVSAAYGNGTWVTKPTSVTDARGFTTTISYIALGQGGAGNPSIVTLPSLGGQTVQYTYTYNSLGQLLTVTDPEGMVTSNTYGASTGFLASSTVDSGRIGLTTSFGYNAAGDQTSVDGPRTDVSDITTALYDAMRRPLEVTDPVGTKSKTIYDKNGRTIRTEVRDSVGTILQVSGTSYTSTGQEHQTFSPECYVGTTLNTGLATCAVTLTTYDAMGRSDIVTDPVGRQSQTVYFESGDVARVMRAIHDVNLEQAYQTYTYVPAGTAGTGQVATVADANGNLTRYSYDSFERLAKTEFPHKTSVGSVDITDYESHIYDLNDNQIVKRTRKGDWIENQYDAHNRAEAKIVHRGGTYNGAFSGTTVENSVYYTYDRLGRDLTINQSGANTLAGIRIPNRIDRYTYDTAGRVLSEQQGSRTVNVGYNAAGARDSLTYPAQGSTGAKTVSFNYDAVGRMTTVVDGGTTLATYGYDALSRKTGLTYLNSAGATYAYQADSAIQTISQGFLGTLSDVSYTFDYNKANQVTNRNISNLAYVFDGFEDEGSTDYTANGLNQYTLTEAAPPPPAGQSNPAPETVVATSYTYDANGSLTSTGRWDYFYDVENRLIKAHDTVTEKMITFQYDGKGRRITKWVDDNASGGFAPDKKYEYLYEGDEPIADYVEVSGTFVITHRYLHGASVDERLVHWAYDQNTGAETAEQFYHRDHQGSIVAMSDASGDRVTGELYTYDAYGNMGLGNTDGQPFRYTGRRWDNETGLYYYRARYYSAKLGRFLQTDPIGYEDNMNLYGYVNNDPVNAGDPTGLASCTHGVGGPVTSTPSSCSSLPGQSSNQAQPKSAPGKAAPSGSPVGQPANDNAPSGTRTNGFLSKILKGLGRLLGVLDAARQLEEANNESNRLYRGLSGSQLTELLSTGRILQSDPNANITKEQHARGVKPSQFHSLTKLRQRAEQFATQGPDPSGVVIELDGQQLMFSGVLEFHTGFPLYSRQAQTFVLKDAEVLLRAPITRSMIKDIYRVPGFTR